MRAIVVKTVTAALVLAACAIAPSSAGTPLSYGSDVKAVVVRKDEVFLLSRKDAASLQVLAVRAGKPLDQAVVLVPARSDRILEAVYPALDAIYVVAREGGDARLLRIPVRFSGAAEIGFTQDFVYRCRNCRSFPPQRYNHVVEIPIPLEGAVVEAHSDPHLSGITLGLESGTTGKTELTYDPALGRFVNQRAEHRT